MDFDTIKDEQLSVLDTSLKYVKSLDSHADFEIYLHYQNRIDVEIDQGVVNATDGSVAGTGVRAAKGKRVGFAVASGISVERVKLAAREALAIINSVEVEDNRFQGFAEPQGQGKEGVFSDEILSLETTDLIESCLEMIKEAREVDSRVKVVNAEADAVWQGYAVGNTRGIMHASRNNNSSCSTGVYAIDGQERRHGFEFDVSRERVYKTEGIGKKAAQNAVSLLGAKKLDMTAKMPTIWTPFSAALYILSSVSNSAVGRPVVDRISPLCDKLGDEIASKEFSLIDDGQDPRGLGTEAVDAEGLPQRRNPLIEKGILKRFLFDHYFGKAFGLESTGNCSRGGGLFGGSMPYEDKPTASSKWFEVTPGGKSEEDIIASIDGKAILIRDFPIGIFHSSVETGDFSCVATAAYLVENGELKGSVEPVSVAGNYYEGLMNLQEIGNNSIAIPYGISIPTLLFDGFSIVG
jgi:PmbA protein